MTLNLCSLTVVNVNTVNTFEYAGAVRFILIMLNKCLAFFFCFLGLYIFERNRNSIERNLQMYRTKVRNIVIEFIGV